MKCSAIHHLFVFIIRFFFLLFIFIYRKNYYKICKVLVFLYISYKTKRTLCKNKMKTFFNLHNISKVVDISTTGTRFVFDASQRKVVLWAFLLRRGISSRLTITCRAFSIVPSRGCDPLNQVTVGSGRPENFKKIILELLLMFPII